MTKSPGRTIKKDYSHISLRNPADLPSGPTEHLPGSVLSGLPPPWDTFALSLKCNL